MKRLLLLLRNKDYRFWVMARKGLLDKEMCIRDRYMYEITPQWLVKPAKQIGKLMKVDFVTDRIAKGSSEKK